MSIANTAASQLLPSLEAITQLAKSAQCPICMDYVVSPITLPCTHIYCHNCVSEMLNSSATSTSSANPLKSLCPLCQQEFTKKDISYISRTLESIIFSIKSFISYYEGKLPSGTSSSKEAEVPLIDEKFRMQRPNFKGGDLVHVAPRLWPGINKPGGAAWIVKTVDTEPDGICYDCKYVLGGGIDLLVPAAYIRVASDVNVERESRTRRSKLQSTTRNKISSKSKMMSDVKNAPHQLVSEDQEPPSSSSLQGSAGKGGSCSGSGGSSGGASSEKRKLPPAFKTIALMEREECRSSGGTAAGRGSLVQQRDDSSARVSSATDRSPHEIEFSNDNASPAVNSPLVFLCSTLSSEELAMVERFCARFPPATVHDVYSNAVTHVIVRPDPAAPSRRRGGGRTDAQDRILKNRTMKYLQGVIGHKWIVSLDWLVESIQKDRIVDETPYEVTRDSKADPTSFGPRWSRESLGPCRPHSRPRCRDLFDQGCRYMLCGPFCHPGPTIDNLSFLLRMGGGQLLSSAAEVVSVVNASLDGGLRVRRKQPPRIEDMIVIIVTSRESANTFCKQLYMSISDIRKECAYDFDDFVDHLHGFVSVVLSDWIFDCISNYTFGSLLPDSRFFIELDRVNNDSSFL